MWLSNGLKAVFLFVITAAFYALGWSSHNSAQENAYRRDLDVGHGLRSELAAQATEYERIRAYTNAYTNAQEALNLELTERRKRMEIAKRNVLPYLELGIEE